MYHAEALPTMIDFLRGIGMAVEVGAEGAADGFLPGINIHGGVIHVDPETLVGSGDLLHEAGHIAIVPRRFWPRLNKDLHADMLAAFAAEPGPTPDPAIAEATSNDEVMAQAWSYAAALAMGVSPESIFFPGSYRVGPYEGTHPMLAWLERGTHLGPLALARAGMAGYPALFSFMGHNGLAPFPTMARWVQE
ncbi:hypothetical protein HHL28_12305 [Aerophototrophica crusticola]|uniref:Uncharacterized protein n=1 Tax=Aerophototrophica crusticola TaxID=1709002 RepID=A0A858R8S0_9PROT|nr:hypothetical protein HHL28_12305 [Rhodospirillaceae bacterium B3]